MTLNMENHGQTPDISHPGGSSIVKLFKIFLKYEKVEEFLRIK